jgi:hypothetical protein
MWMLLAVFPLRAQHKPWAGFGIEANVMGGRIYKHTKNFKAPVPDFSGAFELNFVQQRYGKKAWEQRRGYPLIGVGITYTDYGIDSIFGKCISIYPNVQIPIVSGKSLEWTIRAGFGLGYATRHYERAPKWDTLNNAIGTHLNNYTVFASDLRYRVNNHWDIQLGVNFSHISNASLRTPNLGINLLGAHVGIRYFPVTSRPEHIVRNLAPLKNRWLAQVRLGISANEAGVPNGPLYPIYIVSAYASKRYRSKNKLFAGLDYSYHKNIYAFLRNNEIEPGREKQLSWKSSIFVGDEFLFGKFGIHLQLGYYLKESYLRLEKFYQKIGCNFYLRQAETGAIKESFLSVHLKTHKTQAEFAEVGLGIGF